MDLVRVRRRGWGRRHWQRTGLIHLNGLIVEEHGGKLFNKSVLSNSHLAIRLAHVDTCGLTVRGGQQHNGVGADWAAWRRPGDTRARSAGHSQRLCRVGEGPGTPG